MQRVLCEGKSFISSHFLFFFPKIDFIYLKGGAEAWGEAEGEGEADCPAEQGAQHGTQSQNPKIMT
ncbi:unnamed protein product [Gulo gulo]|uniref:Uncharacterized protein n=1 Tax=Gulo gulo TaxID=48420 RepID=A0A9X9LGR8_GULGU|nr:unnamed protein product [Gulo gulo]